MINGSAGTNTINLPMLKKVTYPVKHIWPLMLALTVLCSCENDLKKIKEISAKYETTPVERTTGVNVLYSDSGHVKAMIETPLMIHYNTSKPYYEMTKGVKITFYDGQLNITSTIISDYAIRREQEKIIEMDKNVVATNGKGDVFRSDQLIWNETDKKVTSQKPVTITTKDGSVINGTSLLTNEMFDPWDISQTTGKFHVTQDLNSQQP